MRREIVDVLRDPFTGERLELRVTEEEDGEIITGFLDKYPIVDGVPYLFDLTAISGEQLQTIESFSSK